MEWKRERHFAKTLDLSLRCLGKGNINDSDSEREMRQIKETRTIQ
jgi:hypothetical protein